MSKISDITVKLELDTTEANEKLNALERQLNRISEHIKLINDFKIDMREVEKIINSDI